jgi:arylsulfatase A-like enzyme
MISGGLLSLALVISGVIGTPIHAGYEEPPSPPSSPDIVVVMVDDLGDTGCADARILKRLPNINQLFVEGGMCFERFINETPLCCPGRATFLSGMHTRDHGVLNNFLGGQLDTSRTLATALDETGYWTVQVGKYLNKTGVDPAIDATPPGWDRALMKFAGTQADAVGDLWSLNGEVQSLPGHIDRHLAELALSELQGAPAGPLFMWLNSHAPHAVPGSKPKNSWKPVIEPLYKVDPRCDAIPPWKPADYRFELQPGGFPLDGFCRALLTVDDMVGVLRAETATQGRDPVWVFMSDNGMTWGRKGFGYKSVPEAVDTPIYMAGPGIATGTTLALLSNIDLPVTLAELAGASMPWAAGKSFAYLLDRDSGDWGSDAARSFVIEEHWIWRFRYGRWFGVRTPEWHLIGRMYDGAWHYRMYKLTVDPWETKNRKRKNPAKFHELKALWPYPL